jgi:hypothetical protein
MKAPAHLKRPQARPVQTSNRPEQAEAGRVHRDVLIRDGQFVPRKPFPSRPA